MQSQGNSHTIVSDRISYYQSIADSQTEKLQSLVKLAQKFLISMKKLQKAVHRKETNVQNEKGDFEQTRKELEQFLKSMKKEGTKSE